MVLRTKGHDMTYTWRDGKLFAKHPERGWLRIDNLSYMEYIILFPVYETHNKAKERGYEAHHVTPKVVQKEIYDVVTDDSCVRMSPFEHWLAHWFLARECEEGESISRYISYGAWKKCNEAERKIVDRILDNEEFDFVWECEQNGIYREKNIEKMTHMGAREFAKAIITISSLLGDKLPNDPDELGKWLCSWYKEEEGIL